MRHPPGHTPASSTKVELHFDLDVWCTSEDASIFRAEASASTDKRQVALYHYELGRIALGERDSDRAMQALLRAYTLRPQFRPPLRLAQLVFRQRGDYRPVIRLLGAEARATQDARSRAALLRQQVRLLWSHIGDLHQARRIQGEALRMHPGDWSTLLLQELFSAAVDDPDGRHAALLQQLELTTDPSLRVALQVNLALLLAESGPRQAIDFLRAAHESDPENLTVLTYLEQLYLANDRNKELVETLLGQANLPGASATWRAQLLARAARIQKIQLNNPAAAIDLFMQSLELHAEYEACMDCFQLLLEQHRVTDAVKVGEQAFELDKSPGFRASFAFQIAELCRLKLSDNQAAAAWYERCLKQDPSYQPAIESLSSILEEAGQFDDLKRIFRADLSQCSAPQLFAQKLYELALILERNDHLDEAIPLHEQALDKQPGYLPSVTALERIYNAFERWEDLIRLHESELSRTEDVDHRVHILEIMASIFTQRLHDHSRAIECYRRALELAPKRLSTLRAMANLCEESECWQDLVTLYEQEIACVADPQRKMEILQRSGEVWDQHIGNHDMAMVCYERVLAIDSEYLPSLQALGSLYRKLERWSDLIRMHEAEIAACSDPEQIVYLLHTIAETYLEKLGDEVSAAETYETILQRKPHDLAAADALGRIRQNREEWSQWIDLLESTVDGLTNDRSRALRMWRIGNLRREHIDDPNGALRDFRRSSRLDGDFAPAHFAMTRLLDDLHDNPHLALIRRALLEKNAEDDAQAASPRQQAGIEDSSGAPWDISALYSRAVEDRSPPWLLYTLAHNCQDQGMTRELCGILQRLVDMTDDEHAATDFRFKLLQLAHETEQAGHLADHLTCLDHEASRISTVRTLEQLVRKSGDADVLQRLLETKIELASDPQELAILYTELAELHWLWERRDEAEKAYRAALERSSNHTSAFWGLSQLLENQQRWDDLAELAKAEGATADSPRMKAVGLTRAASLWQYKLQNMDRAISLYKRALKINPGNCDAYRGLFSIFTTRGDWNQLTTLIEAQIETTSDPADEIALLVDLATIYLNRLLQPKKGEDCLTRVLELDKENGEVLQMLADIRFDQEKWFDAESLYARAEAQLKDHAKLAHVHRRLGEIYLKLDAPDKALDALHRVVEMDPHSLQDPDLLRTIVEVSELADDVSSQVDALEKLAVSIDDLEEQTRIRKRAASLADERLSDEQRAVRILQELLVLNPLDIDGIESLAGIYGRSSNHFAEIQHMRASAAHYRAALSRQPLDSELFNQLSRIFLWQRENDQVFCTFVALAHMESLTNKQNAFLEQHQEACAAKPTGLISQQDYEALVLPEGTACPLRDLLQAIGHSLAKTVASKPSDLDLKRTDRLVSHPFGELCASLAEALGAAQLDFDLWRSATEPDLIEAKILTRPALVVSETILERSLEPADLFRVGRALVLIKEHALVFQPWAGKVRVLLGALSQVAQPSISLRLAPQMQSEANSLARKLGRVTSRKLRRRLPALLQSVLDQIDSLKGPQLLHNLHCAANRAGLVLSGNLLISLKEAKEIVGATDDRQMTDLLLYLVSDEHFALRRELALAPDTD